MKITDNPIVSRSKKWILESLLDLMKKKKYMDITIKDIATVRNWTGVRFIVI